jgi:hypothetical protein
MAQGKILQTAEELPFRFLRIVYNNYTMLVKEYGSPTGDHYRRNIDETDTVA